MKAENNECCPLFHPEKWDENTYNWDHKQFIKATVPTFFHVPFSPMLGKKITKMMSKAEGSNKIPENKEDTLLLFTDPHPFKSEMYLSVTGQVPEAMNTDISGTFMSRVFEGPYRDLPKFMKEMDAYLGVHMQKAKKYYVHYAYCPKCSKEKGHNYMVLFAELVK